MDELDEDARLYGSVNTVSSGRGGPWATTPTAWAFTRPFSTPEPTPPKGRRVVLLGSGGAAKAVALKLAQQGAASVTICNRTLEKARALCARAPEVLSPASFDIDTLRAQAARPTCWSTAPLWA